MLTKQDILSSPDAPMEKVLVPEWSQGNSDQAFVYVKQLNVAELDCFTELQKAKQEDDRLLLLVATVCSEDRQPVFTVEDLEALKRKSVAPILRLLPVAIRLNVMSQAEQDTLLKNLPSPQSDS